MALHSVPSHDENLRCSICLESFKEPKVLPCCHTFCKGCLSKLPVMKKPESELSDRGEPPSRDRELSPSASTNHEASYESVEGEEKVLETASSGGESPIPLFEEDEPQSILFSPDEEGAVATEDIFSVRDQEDDLPTASVNSDLVDYLTCPQCRDEHRIIGPNGVDGFLTDYIAKSCLKERDANPTVSPTNLKCDGCESSEPVVAFCDTCFEYLCEFCSAAHKRLKKFMGHTVKNVGDLDVDETSKEPIASHKLSALYLCRQHPNEVIQLYCQECDAVVCNKCIVSSEHQCHKFVEINSQTRIAVDEKLISLSTTVGEDLKLYVDQLNYVKNVEKVTSDMASELQQKINATFDSYAAELEARQKELLAESERKCSAKMKVLWSERDCLERAIADFTTTREFTKRVRKCKNDKEYLQLTSQVLPRLRKLEDWEWNDEKVEDIERYSLELEESDLTTDLISKACYFEEKQLSHYNVEFRDFATEARLGEERNFTIHIKPRKCCRSWGYIETPTVDLKHVQSRTCDVADISIASADQLDFISLLQPESLESMDDDEKWDLSNTWIVTYTPYCGGQHTLTIDIGDESTERTVTVCGTPTVGSQVMRGPNGYGAVEGEVMSYKEYSKKVSIQVSMWNGVRYRGHVLKQASWGKNDQYEIQLKH